MPVLPLHGEGTSRFLGWHTSTAAQGAAERAPHRREKGESTRLSAAATLSLEELRHARGNEYIPLGLVDVRAGYWRGAPGHPAVDLRGRLPYVRGHMLVRS